MRRVKPGNKNAPRGRARGIFENDFAECGLLLRQLQLLADRELGPIHAGIDRLKIRERDAVRARDRRATHVALFHHVFARTGDRVGADVRAVWDAAFPVPPLDAALQDYGRLQAFRADAQEKAVRDARRRDAGRARELEERMRAFRALEESRR